MIDRRRLLTALLGGAGLSMAGCVIPSRPGPHFSLANRRLFAPGRREHTLLWAGAAVIDLTPPEGVAPWLAGYGFQRRRKEVRDPLSARCLYLDDGVRRVAVVVADLVGLLRPTVERVRALVGPGVEVAVLSTHNHQAPDTMGYWGPALLHLVPVRSGIDRRYQRVLEQRLAQVVLRAIEAAVPARLAFARAELPEGLVKNLRDPGRYDRAIELLEVRRPDGRVLATWVNFGCHPETLGPSEHALTADFPGPLRRSLEATRGGISLYANGILGGMITAELPEDAERAEREACLERIGAEVARVSAAALAQAQVVEVERVDYQRAEVVLPTTNALYRYVERVGLIETRGLEAAGHFTTEVGWIALGPAAWALLPGEPTPMVGLRIKEAMRVRGVRHPAVLGLANDELGYLLDPAEYDDPKFGYESTVSPGREAASLLEQALQGLGASNESGPKAALRTRAASLIP